jgi:hypothetical protein
MNGFYLGADGAMHYGCLYTEIYVGKVTEVKDPTSDTFSLLMMAEVVEVLEATQNKGWHCGYSNGEGLSRVLACQLYPKAKHRVWWQRRLGCTNPRLLE